MKEVCLSSHLLSLPRIDVRREKIRNRFTHLPFRILPTQWKEMTNTMPQPIEGISLRRAVEDIYKILRYVAHTSPFILVYGERTFQSSAITIRQYSSLFAFAY